MEILDSSDRPYFATVARGLEAIAAQELTSLGAKMVQPEFAGVSFYGDRRLLYRVNLWSRVIYRVLMPIAQVKAKGAADLYQGVYALDWSTYLSPEQTFLIDCTGKNPQLNHSHFTALQIKNAIVDQQRDRWGHRSSIDKNNPHLVINAHIRENHCHLSLDSSARSLHRRGYRPAMGQAPLKETLASALLLMAQWTPNQALYDPLCGSGTFVLEAGLQSLNIAPGKFQSQFGFQNWPQYDPLLWQSLLAEAQQGEWSQCLAPLWGSDQDEATIAQARSNAQACGLESQIHFFHRDLAAIEAPQGEGILICNPPYGQRLGVAQELGDFYQQLGDMFKQRFRGWTAFVLSGNKELTKRIGLRPARRMPVFNGSLPCTFLKYELY